MGKLTEEQLTRLRTLDRPAFEFTNTEVQQFFADAAAQVVKASGEGAA